MELIKYRKMKSFLYVLFFVFLNLSVVYPININDDYHSEIIKYKVDYDLNTNIKINRSLFPSNIEDYSVFYNATIPLEAYYDNDYVYIYKPKEVSLYDKFYLINKEGGIKQGYSDLLGYIDISNNNDVNITNGTFYVDVSTFLNTTSDYFLRITYPNGSNVPFCYLQDNGECNNQKSSKIAMKINVPANTQIRLSVYKSSENSATNGDEVFLYYDDFNNPATLSNYIVNSNYISLSISNGVLSAHTSSSSAGAYGFFLKYTFPLSNDYNTIYEITQIKQGGYSYPGVAYVIKETNEGEAAQVFGSSNAIFSWGIHIDTASQSGFYYTSLSNSNYPKIIYSYLNKDNYFKLCWRSDTEGETCYDNKITKEVGNNVYYGYIIRYSDTIYFDVFKVYREYTNVDITTNKVYFKELTKDDLTITNYSIDEGILNTDIQEGGRYSEYSEKYVNGSVDLSNSLENSQINVSLFFDDVEKEMKTYNTITTEGGGGVIVLGNPETYVNFEFMRELKDWGLQKGMNHTLNGVVVWKTLEDGFILGKFFNLTRTFYILNSSVIITYPDFLNFQNVSYIRIYHEEATINRVELDNQTLLNCYEEDENNVRCDLPNPITKGKHKVVVYYVKDGQTTEENISKEFYVTDKNYGVYGYWVDVANLTLDGEVDKVVKILYNFSQNNTFPLYKIVVDWDDGIKQTIFVNDSGELINSLNGGIKHTYSDYGIYDVKLYIYLGNSEKNVMVEGQTLEIILSTSSSGSSTSESSSGGTNISVVVESYNDTWAKEMDKISEYIFIILGIVLFMFGMRHRVEL